MSELKKHKNFVVEGIHGKPIVTDVFYKEDGTSKPIVIFCTETKVKIYPNFF